MAVGLWAVDVLYLVVIQRYWLRHLEVVSVGGSSVKLVFHSVDGRPSTVGFRDSPILALKVSREDLSRTALVSSGPVHGKMGTLLM